jgi:hypothetical protein
VLKVALARSDGRHSAKHVALVLALLLLLAGVASSAVGKHHLARAKPLTASQREKQLGPKPTPHWYWRWVPWRLGEGFAKGHLRAADLRPKQAPHRIPHWAWGRLHFFLRARASASKGHRTKQTTSTGTTTTTPLGGGTYDDAIAYTRTRPSFTPNRTVNVSSASQLLAAIANLQPGDLVKATASFTVSNSSSPALTIKNRLSAPAEIDLTGVKLVYTGTQQVNAVWLNNASNLYIFGGDISTSDSGGVCLRVYGSQHVLWWGFTAHDCGATGFQAQAIGGPVDHDDFQGTIWKVGQHLAWDPHAEAGTGLHAANLWDANQTGAFTNNRFAFYAHDIPVGACVEYGNNQGVATGNVLYLKCVNETDVAQTQTGGNALQIWGNINNTTKATLDVKYLEGDNLQGFAYRDSGLSSGVDASGITIRYGRASNTNQNPRYAGQNPWDLSAGVVYKALQPAP